MQIIQAERQHIADIIRIARETWHHTYKEIISPEQIRYMLNLFYTEHVLEEQIQHSQHHFHIAQDQDKTLGYSHCIEEDQDNLKLSKLYVYPHTQGSGVGRMLMNNVEQLGRSLQKTKILLNVNRQNPAKDFYLRQGYQIVQTIDIPLGEFWLNDFVMSKAL